MSVLTEVSISPQAPRGLENLTRWRVLPCLPTTVPTRSSSLAILALAATISLKVSAILPSTPGPIAGQPHREVAVADGLEGAQQLCDLRGRRREHVGGGAVGGGGGDGSISTWHAFQLRLRAGF